LRVVSQDWGEKKPALRLKVEYELRYRVPPEFEARKTEVDAFAKVNGVFNAWPYFREYIQTTTQRMNLPPIIIPVYRVPPQAPKEAPTASNEQAQPSERSAAVAQR
jgi:hypothetical protein